MRKSWRLKQELLVYRFQESVLLTGEFLLHDESIDPVRDNHIDSGDSVAVEEDNQGWNSNGLPDLLGSCAERLQDL
jgi:hypothetical protein